MMYQILKQNMEKFKYFGLFALITASVLLVTVVLKNDEEITTKEKKVFFKQSDLELIKKFLLTKIRSPFIYIDYKIKRGDSIQKILKKLEIQNNEIQTVINQYKKFGNPNKLLTGNKIDILIEENLSGKNKSITKFSVPVTKSTTIEIAKDELGKIISKKIITQLYKKKVLVENVIINNLYSSAMETNINPDTIIEFARIFGFEIDFQRDVRKNDYFRIIYDNYFDENGEFIKSGSIHYAHMSVAGREITLYKFGSDK